VHSSGAVAAAYFDMNDTDLFEHWWDGEGRLSRGGQQRKQRSTNKKKLEYVCSSFKNPPNLLAFAGSHKILATKTATAKTNRRTRFNKRILLSLFVHYSYM
jgi:hypothetical protein